ncbi:MAG: hypothetical protein WDA60_03795 [Acidimicrobiia bacterium]
MPRAPLLLLLAVAALALGGVAGAQTTTAPPATTTPTVAPTVPPTTASGSATTAPANTATTAPASATSVAPLVDTTDDGASTIPWVPIAIGVAVLALIVAAVAILAKRRGAARQVVTDWKRRAADVTAEAGATARLLSTGTPATGQIAQQLLGSLRGFEDLEHSAPDDSTAATAERARRALQTLGLAIDADYRTRRAQPAPSPDLLAQSQDSVKLAAGETDRTLRGVYRSFTDAD